MLNAPILSWIPTTFSSHSLKTKIANLKPINCLSNKKITTRIELASISYGIEFNNLMLCMLISFLEWLLYGVILGLKFVWNLAKSWMPVSKIFGLFKKLLSGNNISDEKIACLTRLLKSSTKIAHVQFSVTGAVIPKTNLTEFQTSSRYLNRFWLDL